MKKQKLPNIVNVAILTVITVVFWIGLDIYRSLTTKPPISVSPAVIARLEPTLDEALLDKLPQRVYKETTGSGTTLLRSSEESVIATPIPEPSISPTATPEATVSASITPSPTLSP